MWCKKKTPKLIRPIKLEETLEANNLQQNSPVRETLLIKRYNNRIQITQYTLSMDCNAPWMYRFPISHNCKSNQVEPNGNVFNPVSAWSFCCSLVAC